MAQVGGLWLPDVLLNEDYARGLIHDYFRRDSAGYVYSGAMFDTYPVDPASGITAPPGPPDEITDSDLGCPEHTGDPRHRIRGADHHVGPAQGDRSTAREHSRGRAHEELSRPVDGGRRLPATCSCSFFACQLVAVLSRPHGGVCPGGRGR
jgi:hypothetical protein